MKSLSQLTANFATAQQKYKRRSMGDRIGETVVGKTGLGMAARGLALAGAIRYGGVARKEIGAALSTGASKKLGRVARVKAAGGFARKNVPAAIGEAVRADIGRVRTGLGQIGVGSKLGGMKQTQRAMKAQQNRRVNNMTSGQAVYPVAGRTKKGGYRF
jgi:hypothetical protein